MKRTDERCKVALQCIVDLQSMGSYFLWAKMAAIARYALTGEVDELEPWPVPQEVKDKIDQTCSDSGYTGKIEKKC
ncbi:MAG: hypothetical protein GY853_01640 [PVC group bacterium]|nr:hypothetical protein [PVC group bacterium]